MSIGNHDLQGQVASAWVTVLTADDLSATGDAGVAWDIVRPVTVIRVGALVTTVLNGAAVVAFDRRVTTGSDTGRVNGLNAAGDAVITIPTTTAAGKIVYKDVRVDLDPGDQVIAEVTSGATSGAARYFVECVNRDEVAANLSDMVASA